MFASMTKTSVVSVARLCSPTTTRKRFALLLKYKGHTTDLTEEVAGIEINNQPVEEAKADDLIGIKVKERVRENDKVYKVVE